MRIVKKFIRILPYAVTEKLFEIFGQWIYLKAMTVLQKSRDSMWDKQMSVKYFGNLDIGKIPSNWRFKGIHTHTKGIIIELDLEYWAWFEGTYNERNPQTLTPQIQRTKPRLCLRNDSPHNRQLSRWPSPPIIHTIIETPPLEYETDLVTCFSGKGKAKVIRYQFYS